MKKIYFLGLAAMLMLALILPKVLPLSRMRTRLSLILWRRMGDLESL